MKFKDYIIEDGPKQKYIDPEFYRKVKKGRFVGDISEIDWAGDFPCRSLRLTTLVGAPHRITEGGVFNCADNSLRNLIGAPIEVATSMICADNLLTSLEGAPRKIKYTLNVQNNKLTSLHNIHLLIDSIGHTIRCTKNPLKSHILGVLKIPYLRTFEYADNQELEDIINKHLKNGRDVLDCQEELIEAGYEEFAQL